MIAADAVSTPIAIVDPVAICDPAGTLMLPFHDAASIGGRSDRPADRTTNSNLVLSLSKDAARMARKGSGAHREGVL